ncbi:hypothetical protein OUZ56_011953 [Daphnia magna]|uniref:Uncharacterized protein n=1 Tax=Daphnia magna TaxID=35525 RepID=A0ABQ9Z1L7_9CRUS|nr:hypothetical protein OUZ56_011953 [Daphnia magna]
MNILIKYGANTEEIDLNGKTPQDYATDSVRDSVFEYWKHRQNPKRKVPDSTQIKSLFPTLQITTITETLQNNINLKDHHHQASRQSCLDDT